MTDTDIGAHAGDIFAKAFTLGYETGRKYIPEGGCVLTAEQVEDVRIVMTETGSYTGERYRRRQGAKERLTDALFPATEPAEDAPPCAICNVNETNHAGVSYYHPFTAELGPFDDDGNDRPAPAEPAEEETKAEARPPLLTPNQIRDANPGKHQTYIYGQQSADGTACIGCNWETRNILPVSEAVMAHDSAKNWTHDHSVWIAKNGKCPCGQPASSPVVPAPTETGPWQTLAEVPVGVARLVDMRGREFSRGDHGWRPYYYKDGRRLHEFAPFMAVRHQS